MKNLAVRPQPVSPSIEHRRSPRVRAVKSVEVAWHTGDGTYICQHAETLEVSAHGGLLRASATLPVRQVVCLRCGAVSDDWALARVLRSGSPTPEGWIPVAIELAVPGEDVWRFARR